MDNPLPLDNYTSPDDQPFDVGVEASSPNLSPEAVENKAQKFKYGLGDLLQKSKDEIYGDLSQGKEYDLRETAATEIDSRKYTALKNLMTEVSNRKGAPLTDDEKTGLSSMIAELNTKTDPQTVLENAYGRQFLAQLDRTAQGSPGDNVLHQAFMEDPKAVQNIMDNHNSLIVKNQIIDNLLADAHDEAKAQGWFGWGVDVAKSLVPGYTDYMLRGNVRDVGIFKGLGLGENLEEQRKTLMRMTPEQLNTTLRGIYNNLKSSDPSMAVEFLEHMKGVSSDTAALKDLQLPLEVAGTSVATKGVKTAYGAARKVLFKDVEKAAEDMVKAAADPQATKSTIEAASGDLAESAVTRSTSDAVSELSGTSRPGKQAIEALSQTYRADVENIRANPGRLGQDIVNRIVESSNNTLRQFTDAVVNVQKVDRIGDVLANETAVRAVVEGMKDTYRGLKNTVIDVSKPYRNEVDNTYRIDLFAGNTDGTYFKNRQVAQNFIDRFGLNGEIKEATNDAFTPANVAIKKIDNNIAGANRIIERETARLEKAADDVKPKHQEQIDTAREYIADQEQQRQTWLASKQTATVEQQGLGYYVRITKPIDETQPAIRQALAQTKETKIPDSPVAQFLNSWFGKVRTPEEVLSPLERKNRLTVTYAPSEYFKIMVDNAKEIQKLQAGRFSRGRKRWEEWQRGLENAQELPDEVDPTKKGYFFKDPVDMEHYWQQWFNRLPDEQEVAAYFEFKRGMEIDRMFRNIAEHRNQSRVGAETIKITSKDAAGNDISTEFSGVLRKKLPGAEDNILMVSPDGQHKVLPLERQSTAWKKDIQEEMDKGVGTLVEVYAPENKPLNGFGNVGDSRIRYVYTTNGAEAKPLTWDLIPRRGGGHIQYDHDWYIKQAKIDHDDVGNRYWYNGDTTIMASMNRSVGADVAKHLDQVRKYLKEKNETAAMNYSNQNLHMDWSQVQGWFKGGKNADGKFEPPRLSLDEEIRLVPRNGKIVEVDNSLRNKYTNFKDGTREGSLSRQNRVEFAEERDGYQLLQADLAGTKYNPLYSVTPAKAIDPITTMNRGLERIARSNFMDDYKTMAVEHWLRQAAPYLDIKSESELYSSPYYFFAEGKFRTDVRKANPEIIARLEASKYHTQQLVGQPSLVDGLLHSASQKLSDTAVNTIGPKGQVLTPTALLPFLRDPLAYVRSMAFHMKLGLFNIPQLIVQMGNYSNILGIAGYKYASTGTVAAQLHFWTRMNRFPTIIDHLDTLASKFHLPGASSWKPGEFKEAFQEAERTGFFNVRGEYAALDSPTQNKVISNSVDTFLDWGQTPFKMGEENSRYGAWYTAFKEWRDKNPTGKITQADRAQILQRADLLNVNMSRASSSMLNKGVWSVPTQFYAYQMRLFELFFGSRLTAKERFRMLYTNAALYGVPMSVGLTGLPVVDYIRQKAMEENYVVGDNYLTSMLMEGVPSALGAIISGKGDPQAGTWYDVGSRFGTKGFEFLGSAANRIDKSFLDIAGGPAYSIIKDTVGATDGLARAMISLARRDQDAFPMTVEDLIDPLRNISSVNTAVRDYFIMNGGRWVSKNDAYLADANGWDAFMSTAFGLKDQNINNIQIMSNAIKAQGEAEKVAEAQFRQEFRRAQLALKENDPAGHKKFMTRAQAWLELGGFREDRINGLVARAIDDNTSVLDKLNFDFYLRKAPDKDTDSRADALRRQELINDKRRGVQP